jgi:glycosyltransferase involved in cell wall biosynthesis
MRICTIIARNFLPQAEVLAESFHEHHPDGTVTVLVVDDRERLVEGRPGLYEVLRPEELSIPRFTGMAAMYDVTELCTAVKPWLLSDLLQQYGEPVAYFDPDICFYAPVDELVELAAKHQVVLIPHIATPFPEDGERPDGMHILAAGAYNLGFIALGPGDATDALLKWWSARLRFDCINDVRNNYFVDQRWFDLVPGMFPNTALVRDPGMNVAYWNLHERHLRVDDDGQRWIGDAPLRFFHFSGFDPSRPDEVSRHQSRVRLREAPELAALFEQYASRLRAHRIRPDTSTWPFDRLADGRLLDHSLRRLYREGEREGAFQHSPFTVDGTDEFIAWLAAVPPDSPGTGINRYWTYIYRNRPELQGAFPVLAGADGERYLQWIVDHGAAEVDARGLLPARPENRQSMFDPGSVATVPGPVSDGTVWGVNVGGYLESELGTGEAARAVITALDAMRIPVLPVHGRWRPGNRQGHRFAMFETRDAVFPINLLCVNADMMETWLAEAGPAFRADRYTIGLWWWEVTSWPERWLGAFDLVDEVWVATDHIHAALRPVATVPVTKITLPIAAPAPTPRTREKLGLPNGFLFFFMFDYASVVERKNPLDTVDAFIRAFAPGEGAKLVIKCINQDLNPRAHDRLRSAAGRHPDIEILEGYVSAADKNSMVASADCYVSLHRAEGFGLPLAESLLLGKPVIATRYSGNLDFMSPTGSWLVDAETVAIGPGNDPYPADGEWAQPDVDQASRFMREIFEDPVAAVDRAARGAELIRRTHSRRAAGETMAARLELLHSRRAGWPNRRGQDPIVPDRRELEAASGLLAQGPLPTRPNPGAARSLVRQSALRVMKPYTAFERQVDNAMVEGIRALGERIESQQHESEARFGTQIAIVAAAVRDLELSVAAGSAHLATVGQQAARLEASQATAMDRLSDHVGRLQQHVEAFQIDAADRLAELLERARLAEVRLQQLETPPLVSDRSRYLALAALHRAHAEIGSTPREGSPSDALDGYELRGFSQNGEDGVLAEILTRIGAENRFFVEFGIENGQEGNCVYLADRAGWEGLFIEADPEMYRQLSRKYAEAGGIRTLEQRVTPENVDRLFGEAEVPESFDILSVDVDGSDYWVWRAVEAYRPRVVVIEYNSSLRADRALVQPPDHGPWDGTDFQGASLGAMVRLGVEKGYQLVHTETSGVNAFFVREELAVGHFPESDTVDQREPNYFQIGYHHPPDTEGRRYLDLDTGELVHPPVDRGREQGDTAAADPG